MALNPATSALALGPDHLMKTAAGNMSTREHGVVPLGLSLQTQKFEFHVIKYHLLFFFLPFKNV